MLPKAKGLEVLLAAAGPKLKPVVVAGADEPPPNPPNAGPLLLPFVVVVLKG